jgi:hypothetical protein
MKVKSILDPSFDYTPSSATDIRKTFERVWRELDEREQLENADDVDRDSVWLECNGDLVDSATVEVFGVRRSALGVEMVEFVCPRCNERHESLRFR